LRRTPAGVREAFARLAKPLEKLPPAMAVVTLRKRPTKRESEACARGDDRGGIGNVRTNESASNKLEMK
jgi:hypothetical protein